MWSLILVMFVPLEPPVLLGELSRHETFSQCVYSQNIGQREVTIQDTDSILFCVKDFKNTYGAKE